MISNSQGNILKIVRRTGCSLKVAEKALYKATSWSEAYKYASE